MSRLFLTWKRFFKQAVDFRVKTCIKTLSKIASQFHSNSLQIIQIINCYLRLVLKTGTLRETPATPSNQLFYNKNNCTTLALLYQNFFIRLTYTSKASQLILQADMMMSIQCLRVYISNNGVDKIKTSNNAVAYLAQDRQSTSSGGIQRGANCFNEF